MYEDFFWLIVPVCFQGYFPGLHNVKGCTVTLHRPRDDTVVEVFTRYQIHPPAYRKNDIIHALLLLSQEVHFDAKFWNMPKIWNCKKNVQVFLNSRQFREISCPNYFAYQFHMVIVYWNTCIHKNSKMLLLKFGPFQAKFLQCFCSLLDIYVCIKIYCSWAISCCLGWEESAYISEVT